MSLANCLTSDQLCKAFRPRDLTGLSQDWPRSRLQGGAACLEGLTTDLQLVGLH